MTSPSKSTTDFTVENPPHTPRGASTEPLCPGAPIKSSKSPRVRSAENTKRQLVF